MLRSAARILNRSLSMRLLLFAGAAIALALMLAWIALGYLFERHSERQLQDELERQGIALVAALELDAAGRPRLSKPLVDPRFDRPGSGLYWKVRAPAGELRSRSLWDGVIPPPDQKATRGWTSFDVEGPFEDRILVVARTVQPSSAGPVLLVEVAADRLPVARARSAFASEAAVFLAILWLALAIAAAVQVWLGLRPLRAVSDDLSSMSTTIDARLADADYPIEIRPLTDAINVFADQRAADVEQARQRARDLAHALKTPITALRMQIDALEPRDRGELSHSLALLSGAVESELARGADRARGQVTVAGLIVDRLLTVVSRTPDGSRLDLRNRLPGDLVIPMSDEAALEAFGALIENAARHAASAVEISGHVDPQGHRRIRICDDGDGIAEALRPAALGRGVRLDERGTRHGLGLSIAQQFVTASGGVLTLQTASLGGLSVQLDWPPAVETRRPDGAARQKQD